jgi:predicted dienelactone hydrolase
MGRYLPVAFALLVLVLLLPAPARAQWEPRHAGIARITVAGDVPFDALVWYPTDDDDGVWTPGPFALQANHDAAVADGRFPIVLLSHGGGSSGGSPMVLGDISAALARNGFIVIAPFHGDHAPALRLRPPQIVRALTAVLADKRFKDHADPARLGMLGFSLGGAVTLSLAGATPDAGHFSAYCDAHWQDVASCANAPGGGGGVIEGAIRTAITADVTKPITLKAIVLLDPFSAIFDHAGLAAVTMPVLVIRPEGSALGADGNALALKADLPRLPLYLVIPGSHFVFTDVCTAALAGTEPDLCQDPPDVNRAAVHAFIAPRIVQFFQNALPPPPLPAPGVQTPAPQPAGKR